MLQAGQSHDVRAQLETIISYIDARVSVTSPHTVSPLLTSESCWRDDSHVCDRRADTRAPSPGSLGPLRPWSAEAHRRWRGSRGAQERSGRLPPADVLPGEAWTLLQNVATALPTERKMTALFFKIHFPNSYGCEVV